MRRLLDKFIKDSASKKLGIQYLFLYNEYQGLWFCVNREHWKELMNEEEKPNCTSGETIDEAAQAMIKKNGL